MASIGAQPATRLGDFTFAGRFVPLAAFALLATGMYFAFGNDITMKPMGTGLLALAVELCASYLVAFALLAALARILGPDPPWQLVVLVAVLGAVLGGCAAAAIAFAPAPDWEAVWSTSPRTVVREWLLGTTFSAFFVGLSLVGAAAREREQSKLAAEHRALEERLQLLAARIEPHFLMNTLANLRHLVRKDSAAAQAMLDHLADFLQGALERSRDPKSTLDHELQVVESYLAIMRIRLGEQLRFEIDVPQAIRTATFPPLLLQTLVENSITHGFSQAEDGGQVWIRGREEYRHFVLSVGDNGAGIGAKGRPGLGLGLRNVRERLEAFYLGRASFTIGSAPGGGTEAVIMVPREAH